MKEVKTTFKESTLAIDFDGVILQEREQRKLLRNSLVEGIALLSSQADRCLS